MAEENVLGQGPPSSGPAVSLEDEELFHPCAFRSGDDGGRGQRKPDVLQSLAGDVGAGAVGASVSREIESVS